MSAAKENRRLAVIMFTDMVGYSALCQKDERLAAQLLEEHRRMVRAALAEVGGREVDTTGDGFLLEYQSAVQAVQCAVLLQQRQASRNAAAAPDHSFQFRVGIHLGEIETREHNIIGDGVNIAARLEPLSPHGGLAISGAVHSLVRNRLEARFRSIGTPGLKNISEPIEVFVLEAADVPVVSLPQPEVPGRARKAGGSSWKLGAVIAAAVVAIVLIGVLRKRAPDAGPAAADKSVAVLPFANFSADKDNEYFASGIHDNLLTHLARVKDLKVISRTSVMQYKEGARNLREIGEALGVGAIVEGSVQRAGNRVRVQAQLIEVATDRHLWADSFDRELADVFAIQSEIAERIVAGVQASLTPQEKGRIEQRPTKSAEAYDYYLRADELMRSPNSNYQETAFQIGTLIDQALALDPDFALAYALRGRLHTEFYWWGLDTTARRRDLAREALETALRLQPDLAETRFAMGVFHYRCYRDYDAAIREYEEALRRAPSSGEIVSAIGYVQRRRGQWPEAIASLKRAIELDPRNATLQLDLGETYFGLRRYAEMHAAYLRAAELAPEDLSVRLAVAFSGLFRTGDERDMVALLETLPPEVDPSEIISVARITLARTQGRYAEVIERTRALQKDGFSLGPTNFPVPKEFVIGQAYVAMGEDDRARPHFERAAERMRAYVAAEPDSINAAAAHAWLGLAQAYLGDKDEALRNAVRAAELLPVARDAYDGTANAITIAAIHLRIGDVDRALSELARLLEVPGGSHAPLLVRNPEWLPLRNDPRFRKLIADHMPAT